MNLKVGIDGWRRYGELIKTAARRHAIDPYVLGAYVWVESEFDAKQDYTRGPRRALGLGSVQATDFPRYTTEQLLAPALNLDLTAREFRQKWRPDDMFGTVMDVWYPAWRRLAARGEAVPVIKQPAVYVQAIANRYYALRDVERHLVRGAERVTPKKVVAGHGLVAPKVRRGVADNMRSHAVVAPVGKTSVTHRMRATPSRMTACDWGEAGKLYQDRASLGRSANNGALAHIR